MELRAGGRNWKSMAAAVRCAKTLLTDEFEEGYELEGFCFRLVRDLIPYHTTADWFLETGEVGRITTETQNDHPVFAIYVGPEQTRHYFGTNNIRWKQKTDHRRISDIARSMIGDQIKTYRTVNPRPTWCEICQSEINDTDPLVVDHIIPFHCLLAAFRALHGDPSDLSIPDPEWVTSWQEFHQMHATLRGVHTKCNTERGAGLEDE
jgi:hypothetical protein